MLTRTIRPLQASAFIRAPLTVRRIPPIPLRTLQTTSTDPTSSETPIPPPPAPSSTIAGTSQAEAQNTPQLPYFVGRTNLNNLPVYQRNKRGGSLEQTLIKKVEGNIGALARDIAEGLHLEAKDVRVNNVTRHIQIKGHCKDKVIDFLRALGA